MVYCIKLLSVFPLSLYPIIDYCQTTCNICSWLSRGLSRISSICKEEQNKAIVQDRKVNYNGKSVLYKINKTSLIAVWIFINNLYNNKVDYS